MKITGLLFVITTLFTLPAHAVVLPNLSGFKQETIFQNWLFNRCIARISEGALRDDAARSAAAWLEFSQLSIEAFNQGDAFINEGLKQNVSGSVPGTYNVLKCTLLSQSESARQLFNTFTAAKE